MAAPHATRDALRHYGSRFEERYHGKATIGSKDSTQMFRLVEKHGREEVIRRLDAYFESSDPWFQHTAHDSLNVFFSASTQTTLVAQLANVTADVPFTEAELKKTPKPMRSSLRLPARAAAHRRKVVASRLSHARSARRREPHDGAASDWCT